MVPEGAEGDCLSLVTDEPINPDVIVEIEQLCGRHVALRHVPSKLYRRHMREVYGLGAEALAGEGASAAPQEKGGPPDVGTVRFVWELLSEAVTRRASDIHLEPSIEGLQVRLRVDGLLEVLPVSTDLSRHSMKVASRIKVLAGLDPSPSKAPKEGRIRYEGRDLRVSILPVPRGEAVHLRFLSPVGELPDLSGLGLSSHQCTLLCSAARIRGGLIVACGPTGSGKSTTLHVLLREAIPLTEKIITVEDPVEYELKNAVQVEVRPKVSFASALKAVLRHDPDVILIGEMRDSESADIAVEAALTGHLVLTSLHTEDEIQAITRLRQLGLSPGLLASSLRLLISQRLVRRICSACRGTGESEGVSCTLCGGSGLKGRIGLFRITRVDEELLTAIESGADETRLRTVLQQSGAMALPDVGSRLVEKGITTAQEVIRVLGDRV